MNTTKYSLLWLCVVCEFTANAAGVQLVSASDPRLPGPATGPGISSSARITPDGRFVVFVSDVPSLTTHRPITSTDVFWRDRASGKTALISVDAGGNGDSRIPSVSSNGQWVAFCSAATHLVPGDTNNAPDVFLRKRGQSRIIKKMR
jgi:Tol biopolymer transport system component